jgi:dimethylargininase
MTQHLLPKFTHILARRPALNFADGLTTAELGIPDYAKATEQYESYLQALRDCGLSVTVLDADDRFPDGHFVEDPVIVYKNLAFLCRSGARERREEAQSLLPHLANFDVINIDNDSAFIDGGDVLFCAERVLVGQSERTNQAGADALCRALQTVKSDIRVDTVPFSGVLHLKSGITELAPNVLVCDPAFKTDYSFDWAELITLPAEEGAGADVMPINDTIFIVEGYPRLRKVAEKYYDRIVALNMSEFQKMDGALTCLSLRY